METVPMGNGSKEELFEKGHPVIRELKSIPEIIFEEQIGMLPSSAIPVKSLFARKQMDHFHVDSLILKKIALQVLHILKKLSQKHIYPGLIELQEFYVDMDNSQYGVVLLHPEKFQLLTFEQDYEWYPEDERIFGDATLFDEKMQQIADNRLIYKILVASAKGNVKIPPLKTEADYSELFYNILSEEWKQIFENRDPRMAETIMPAGFIASGDVQAKKVNPTYGGLGQVKFYPRTQDLNGGYGKNYNDLPIFRYAEVLLINAEAKAELGTITANDINSTVNLLRNRVGVTPMDMGNLPNDPVIAAQYPNVTGANAKVILEIRRERRVEMACEGLRTDDIKRWCVGELMERPSEGMYIPGFGPLDITGDGEPDIAIFKTPADNNLSGEEKDKLTVYTLFDETGKEQGIYLSEGDKGYIRFVKDKNIPITFISPKYYYYPIPFTQVQLNPNLKQPTGW